MTTISKSAKSITVRSDNMSTNRFSQSFGSASLCFGLLAGTARAVKSIYWND